MKKMTPGRAARAFCLWCCGDEAIEVRHCPDEDCVLWKYRFGKGRIKVKQIRQKCFHCSGVAKKRSSDLVKKCHFDGKHEEKCPLWDYRTGHNPSKAGRKPPLANGFSKVKAFKNPKIDYPLNEGRSKPEPIADTGRNKNPAIVGATCE